jgi:potassium intermediate/small conductance calcium-activated channel subfamily N protein 2
MENTLLFYNLFCTLALVLGIYFRYTQYLEWFKAKGTLSEYDSLVSTSWYQSLIKEQLLVIISPFPYLDELRYYEYNDMFKATISYSANEILLCLSFLRVYLLIRFFLVTSRFMNPRSKRICAINGCDANLMFAMKAYMKQKPYQTIGVYLGLTVLIFGYQLKILEGPLSEASNQDFNNFQNAMWNVVVTLATVGYGDFYMKTILGRIVGLVVCFWGTFVVSYFVVTVTSMLTFAAPEEKSYMLLLRLHYKEELKQYAVNVLTQAFKQRAVRLKEPDNEDSNLQALRDFRGSTLSFQRAVG